MVAHTSLYYTAMIFISVSLPRRHQQIIHSPSPSTTRLCSLSWKDSAVSLNSAISCISHVPSLPCYQSICMLTKHWAVSSRAWWLWASWETSKLKLRNRSARFWDVKPFTVFRVGHRILLKLSSLHAHTATLVWATHAYRTVCALRCLYTESSWQLVWLNREFALFIHTFCGSFFNTLCLITGWRSTLCKFLEKRATFTGKQNSLPFATFESKTITHGEREIMWSNLNLLQVYCEIRTDSFVSDRKETNRNRKAAPFQREIPITS